MNTKEYISSGIIESYILGLASPEEAGILECIMKNNAEVKAAFEEAQKTLEDLATAQALSPPTELKSKIWHKIQQQQKTESHPDTLPTDLAPVKNLSRHQNKKSYSWKIITAAASILLLISLASNVFWINIQSRNELQIAELQTQKQSQNLAIQQITQKLKLFSNPNIHQVALKGVEKHPDSEAVVLWDTETKAVYLSAENLPKAPEGMQYQLWAIVDGKPVSAGMYSIDKDSRIALANIPRAQAFAITLEKEGGSKIPTMENMFVIGSI
ncbi:anti-sigma factor [Epilithonimonas mollis]|uniref:Anti-sigma-K factor RskA n=1 Tax=Epilithonimonas mollis TaxID=216903 RepID=A0A1M6TK00_9FLAO|nr:anti-sigma factor [Epilithonimonas mollis]SHK57267.1 Anti-sigma-K factor RskA [Epilithonimonas mollis]